MSQQDIVIVAAARTAIGKFGGTLAKTPAPELGAAVIQELLKRARLSGEQINEVILGQAFAAVNLAGDFLGQAVAQEAADLVAECAIFGGVIQIHGLMILG